MMDVTKNPQESRYELHLDGELAGHLDYVIEDGVIDFQHTIVPDAFAGKGIASKLLKGALEDVEEEGTYQVKATCPFVKGYFKKNPDVQHLLAEGIEDEIVD